MVLYTNTSGGHACGACGTGVFSNTGTACRTHYRALSWLTLIVLNLWHPLKYRSHVLPGAWFFMRIFICHAFDGLSGILAVSQNQSNMHSPVACIPGCLLSPTAISNSITQNKRTIQRTPALAKTKSLITLLTVHDYHPHTFDNNSHTHMHVYCKHRVEQILIVSLPIN